MGGRCNLISGSAFTGVVAIMLIIIPALTGLATSSPVDALIEHIQDPLRSFTEKHKALQGYMPEINKADLKLLLEQYETIDLLLMRSFSILLIRNNHKQEVVDGLLALIKVGPPDPDRALRALKLLLSNIGHTSKEEKKGLRNRVAIQFVQTLRKAKGRELISLLRGVHVGKMRTLTYANPTEVSAFLFEAIKLEDDSVKRVTLPFVAQHPVKYWIREDLLPHLVYLSKTSDSDISAKAAELLRVVTHQNADGDTSFDWSAWWKGAKNFSVIESALSVAVDAKAKEGQSIFAMRQLMLLEETLTKDQFGRAYIALKSVVVDKTRLPRIRRVALIRLAKSKRVNSQAEMHAEIIAIAISLVDHDWLGQIALISLGNIDGAIKVAKVYDRLISVIRDDEAKSINKAWAGYSLRYSEKRREVSQAVMEALRNDLNGNKNRSQEVNLKVMTLKHITGENHNLNIDAWGKYINSMKE